MPIIVEAKCAYVYAPLYMEKPVKKSPYFLVISIVIALLGSTPLFANEAGIDFSIRFFDRRVYHLEQEPILIQITLTNNSPAPYRFKLANERPFSIDFDVRTGGNQMVALADTLIRTRSQSQQVFFREVLIDTGESFSFVENVSEYAAFHQTGSYVVQARLYPELFGQLASSIVPGRTLAAGGAPLVSNRLTFTLRPQNLLDSEGIPVELDVETNAVLSRQRLPPDEVVRYLLTARQRGQWERFFLYMDLETMLSRDQYRRRQWLAESEEGRRRMLVRYRQDLQSAVVDGDISLIPLRFTVERTNYTDQSGTVTTLQYFREGDFIQRKRYEWYLERNEDFWTIVGYSVDHLGPVDRLPD